MSQDLTLNISFNKDVFDKHFSIQNYGTKESSTLLSIIFPIFSYALKTHELQNLSEVHVNKLYKEFVKKIAVASDVLKDIEYSDETIAFIQYALCLFCDECINDINDNAVNKNFLVNIFFGDVYNDKNFYSTIDELCQNPIANLNVLEVYLWCLNLGFDNKINMLDDNNDIKQETITKLNRILKRYCNNTIALDNALSQLLINCNDLNVENFEIKNNVVSEYNKPSYRKFSIITLITICFISLFIYVVLSLQLNNDVQYIDQATKKLSANNIILQNKLPIT